MSNTAAIDHPEPLTLEKVYRELQILRERVEDIEDLHDLEEAIVENAGKPLIPWDEAKKDLDLDCPQQRTGSHLLSQPSKHGTAGRKKRRRA